MKKITTVFIDLDGVLVDWLEGIREHMQAPVNIYDGFRKDPKTLCHDAVDALYGGRGALKKIQLERPEEWWLGLKFFPWAKYLVSTMQENFPVAFLTSPGTTPTAAKAKIQWQINHYPEIPIIVGKHKYLAANETKVLIDDDNWQLSRWRDVGGLAIRWPNQFEWEDKPLWQTKAFISSLVIQIQNHEQAYHE